MFGKAIPQNTQSNRRTRRHRVLSTLALITIIGACSAVLTSCSVDEYASPDAIKCIIDDHTGKTVQTLYPGEDKISRDDNDTVVEIPGSVRFYYMDEDDSKRDPGAANHVEVTTYDFEKMYLVPHIEAFQFNRKKACEWFERFGRRNLNGKSDLGFNVRGDPSQGWFLFLNEKFGTKLDVTGKDVARDYSAPATELNFSVNADSLGFVVEGVDRSLFTRAAIEDAWTRKFNDALASSLNGVNDYFCGEGYNPDDDASTCPPLKVSLVDARMENRTKVDRLKDLRAQAEQIDLDKQAAALNTPEAQKAATDARDAAIIQSTNQKAVANAQAAVSAAKATLDAQVTVAPCLAVINAAASAAATTGVAPAPFTGTDCAKILAAVAGTYTGNDGNVIVQN